MALAERLVEGREEGTPGGPGVCFGRPFWIRSAARLVGRRRRLGYVGGMPRCRVCPFRRYKGISAGTSRRLRRERESETTMRSWRHEITMAELGRDSRDRARQGYQQPQVHAISKKEHYPCEFGVAVPCREEKSRDASQNLEVLIDQVCRSNGQIR
jgi:hypothetical protein